MATKSEEFFHDKWLGMVQTESDGLVVAKPVLIEAGCANTQSPEVQEKLRELCPPGLNGAPRRILDLMTLFHHLLDFDSNLFEATSAIAEEVSLYAPEGPQTIRPSFGLLRQDEPEPRVGAGSSAANAAAKYVALIWDVTEIDDEVNADAIGLSLDKPETITGPWSYPVAAKFDRLLRHCRVPVGILTNREVIRLVYAPHGESSGHITFRIEDMATVGGRPILDAMIMLLCANQWFGVSEKNSLPSLLRRSREYQGTVTTDLAEQVFSGLEALLKGFQTAAERDKSGLLREALESDKDHLYRGLLTVMLRLVFILYAEDRTLLPVDHPLYAKQMSLLGLFERLQRDQGNFPDSMNNRFSAWGHIVSLSRAIYLGVDHDDFHIPPRHGDLFDPHRYSFLEGWTGASAPIVTQSARAEVRVPTVDDGTVFILLQSLLIFQGQRLSYRTLDVEQIGSVYEALMGYQVWACKSQAVAIKLKGKKGAPRYWLEVETALERPVDQRLQWLKDECGFETRVATKINSLLCEVEKKAVGTPNAAVEALLSLAPGKKELLHEQQASAGQYVLQPGAERRRSGTQYTPRSLTAPIVQKMLEPLICCLGEEPTAEQLLDLKLCDPAMGSGAFLVECCRQLADEVVAAWGRARFVEGIAAQCPDGDVVAHARRLVAQRCLYGVDKNAMAVQLAKLSLWLFTLARNLPFTFLDHSLRHGDSLVGLNLEQIESFHWKPSKQLGFLEAPMKEALEEVVRIRQEIHQLASDTTPEGQMLKAQRLFDANDATQRLRLIADNCVGAFFAETENKSRLVERQVREDRVREWLLGNAEAGFAVAVWGEEIRKAHAPFHWWLEFPEVFYDSRPDPLCGGVVNRTTLMDGLIGNPPFLGGTQLTKSQGGPTYAEWLKMQNSEASGQVDLCAYFFPRAFSLLGQHGTIGFLATNSIAQGDSRTSGLKPLLKAGGRIYEAIGSFVWPGDAVISVALVHLGFGNAANKNIPCRLDGREVEAINSRLRPGPELPDPVSLSANAAFSFKGTDPGSNGFVLDRIEHELLAGKLENKSFLSPYLAGQDVTTSPTQAAERFIINFGKLSLVEASKCPDLLEIVRQRVKPSRDQGKDHGPGMHGKKYWWQHTLRRDPLYEAIGTLQRCLVAPTTSKFLVFAFQPTAQVFSTGVYVFPIEIYSFFAVLQSRIHEPWVRLHSSSMKTDFRYAASDCFDNFPFPLPDAGTVIPAVEAAGMALYSARETFMIETSQGLTKTYNALRDPESEDERVFNLRRLHEIMDRAVLDAYGWSDIEVPPYCSMNEQEEVALGAFSDEVIDRLYVLNAKRVAEERLQSQNQMLAKKEFTSNESQKGSVSSMSLPGMDV